MYKTIRPLTTCEHKLSNIQTLNHKWVYKLYNILLKIYNSDSMHISNTTNVTDRKRICLQ